MKQQETQLYGRVENDLCSRLRYKRLHFTLIDPDKQPPAEASHIARAAAQAGSDALLVGGSTVKDIKQFESTIVCLKESSELPVILFPGGSAQVSCQVDAILFICLLNSQDPRFLIGEQAKAAITIHEQKMETLPTGYLVMAPGGAVGQVGKAALIEPDQATQAVSFSLAAKMLGMRYLYLEAGSGAAYPVSTTIIREVKKHTHLPLIVGGGIRSPESAMKALQAGADIIVTGTLHENVKDVYHVLSHFLAQIKPALSR